MISAPDQPELSTTKGHILFVDDDAFYRQMAQSVLEDAGFEVTLAQDGETALELAHSEVFDLIVIDLSMPGLTGFDVIQRLHGPDGRPTIPTLVITGHEDTQSVETAFQVGASSFLAKPVNWVLFVHHVKFLLKAVRAESDLKTATRMAEFMNSLKTRLISTIVNDAQAPLKSAFGFATLMSQEADGPLSSPLYATWINEIHRALEKVVATHTKMLDFGRALSDTIQLSEQPFNLTRLVIDLANDMADLGVRRALRLDRQAVMTTPMAFNGDPALIGQALRVPLESAMKLSSRGSTVVISLSEQPNGDIAFSIVDSSATAVGSLQMPARPGNPNGSSNIEHSSSMRLMRSIIEAHGGTYDIKAEGSQTLRTVITLPRARRTSNEAVELNKASMLSSNAISARPKTGMAEGLAPPPIRAIRPTSAAPTKPL
jgi:two-component system, sensor histidine kinase and response regulator